MTESPNITDGGEIIPPETKVEVARPLIIALIIGVVFVFAIGLGLGIVYFSSKSTPPKANTPPPQNPPMFEPVAPKEKSQMATDTAVLKTLEDVSAFQQELNRLDLLEPQLAPPTIDLNITIQ